MVSSSPAVSSISTNMRVHLDYQQLCIDMVLQQEEKMEANEVTEEHFELNI